MNRSESLRRIGTSALQETSDGQERPANSLTYGQSNTYALTVSDDVANGQGDADTAQEATNEHQASSSASVHGPHPTHANAARRREMYPHPEHPAWIAFMDGYLAGIAHGIGMGRAQISQENANAETFPNENPTAPSFTSVMFAADGLSRHEFIKRQAAAREAARAEYTGPNLTPEQIRENAFRSWGLTPTDTTGSTDTGRWWAA